MGSTSRFLQIIHASPSSSGIRDEIAKDLMLRMLLRRSPALASVRPRRREGPNTTIPCRRPQPPRGVPKVAKAGGVTSSSSATPSPTAGRRGKGVWTRPSAPSSPRTRHRRRPYRARHLAHAQRASSRASSQVVVLMTAPTTAIPRPTSPRRQDDPPGIHERVPKANSCCRHLPAQRKPDGARKRTRRSTS